MKSGCTDGISGHFDWDQWLAEHGPKFLLFARQQTRFEVDAQDLVQEAVVECWRRQASDVAPAAGLVFATIRRRAIDLGRSTDRRTDREVAAAGAADSCWFDFSVEQKERAEMIQLAMNTLPQIYREVLTLKIWGELTFAEIAEALDVPANTAASRYRYGLTELRKLTKGDLA